MKVTKLKRILIVTTTDLTIIRSLQKAFGKAGIEAHGFNPYINNWFDRHIIHHLNKQAHNLRILPKDRYFFNDHPMSHLQYRSRMLLEKVEEISPDLVLIIRGISITEDVMRKIRGRAVLFGWWVEGEEMIEEPLKEMDFFDHYFFISSSCVEESRKRGFGKTSLLRHSVDPDIFHPVECEKRYDWCFVGAWSHKRQAYIEKAAAVSGNGAIYGKKWFKKNIFNPSIRKAVKGKYIRGDGLIRLYGETRVALNISRWNIADEKRTGENMRVLEVPACRAALLTEDSQSLSAIVTPQRHVIAFNGIDDFGKRLAYYIGNEGERLEVAREGFEHVTSRYSYEDMAKAIIERYGEHQGAG